MRYSSNPIAWTSESDHSPRRIIVVEDRADLRDGHFPVLFADLATGFAEIGCTAEALVARGWSNGRTASTVPFTVHSYSLVGRALSLVAVALGRVPGVWWPTTWLRSLGAALGVRLVAREVEARRRAGGDVPADVVVLCCNMDPVRLAAAAGPGNWLHYPFASPPQVLAPAGRRVVARAREVEAARRHDGGKMHIGVPSEEWARAWTAVAPFLDTSAIWIAMARSRAPVQEDARERLGLASGDCVALVFGSAHHDKDLDVVWRAFEELPEWRLLVVGKVAATYRSHRASDLGPVLIGGHVDDATRDLAFAAADLVVLSFRSGYSRDSAVLTDAISYGVPVVCSNRSVPAEVVAAYHLGPVFEAGNASALVEAVSAVPVQIAAADLARARRDYSNAAVAQRFLRVLRPERLASAG